MFVSNIENLNTTLQFELDADGINTKPLSVISVTDDTAMVASSRDADLIMRLHGVKGLRKNMAVAINVKTGELTIVDDKKAVAAPEKQTTPGKTSNCANYRKFM